MSFFNTSAKPIGIRFVQTLVQRVRASEFAKYVCTLAGGTLGAQVIAVVSSPIITRLYGPESFAALALFMSVVSSIEPIVSGRYDVTVVVAKDPNERKILLTLSVWVGFFTSTVISLVFIIASVPLQSFFNTGVLGVWFYFIPFGLFLTAMKSVLNYYANSHEDYKLMARVAISQAMLVSGVSILLGWFGCDNQGLLIAFVVGLIFAVLFFVLNYWHELKRFDWRLGRRHWILAKLYRDFPIYNATTGILNGGMAALPVLFLTKYFMETIVGYYALLTRVALAPFSFISIAISNVHLKKVADCIHQKLDPKSYMIKITSVLVAIMVPPTILFMCYAPELFEFAFGREWRGAGELLVILMPALAIKFVVSTVSGVFSSTGNNRIHGVWRIMSFLSTFCVLWFGCENLDLNHLFFAIMLNDVILYSVYYGLIWYALINPKHSD